MRPRLLLCLAPVAFYQYPSAIAMDPVMRNPDSARMRRPHPVPFYPYVAMPVPAVIAVVPNPAGMRWVIVDLDNWGRGCNPHHHAYLGDGSRRQKRNSKQKRKNRFFHECDLQ